MVYRLFVYKRQDFAVESIELFETLKTQLKIETLKTLKIVHRYDIEGVNKEQLLKGSSTILSEPMVDDVVFEEYEFKNEKVFAIEYLPGQYDQRADACEQCFQVLTGSKNVKVKCAKLIVINSEVSDNDLALIQKFLINPVDQRLANLEKPSNLAEQEVIIQKVPVIEGFINYTKDELVNFLKDNGMAMNYDDLKVTQDYFKNEEKRDPTETELKVLDTYWSDHCRHTTFSTIITDLKFL